MIILDGITWDIPCEVSRSAEIRASEISGLLLDKREFVDITGTYLSYKVNVPVPLRKVGAYNKLYEALTDAVGWHTATLPYGNDVVTLTGKILGVQDTWYKTPTGNYWEGCSFTIVGTVPTKTHSLSEAISYGLPPWPQTVELPVGSVWEYTAVGWQAYDAPPDADDIYY